AKFIRQCSREELIELQLLLDSPSVQHRMEEQTGQLSLPQNTEPYGCTSCSEKKEQQYKKARDLREAIINSTDNMVSDHLRAELRRVNTDLATVGIDCENCQDKIL